MIYVKKCENCGTKFQTSRRNQKFCSSNCRTYFKKKITIVISPKPIKIEAQQFGRRPHKNPSHIINDTKKILKKLKKKKTD